MPISVAPSTASSPTLSAWCARPSRRARARCTITSFQMPAASTYFWLTPAAACAEVPAHPSATPGRERVVSATQLDADRYAGKIESLAQTVAEIAQVGLRQSLGARAEGDESGRPRRGLRHEADFRAAPVGGRRRMSLEGFAKPAVEVAGGHAPVPDLIAAHHLTHEPIEATPRKRGDGDKGHTRNLRQLLRNRVAQL